MMTYRFYIMPMIYALIITTAIIQGKFPDK